MRLSSTHRKTSWPQLLIAELPLLAATIGMMAWALSVLASSIRYADYPEDLLFYQFIPSLTFSTVIAQVVTGYASTSTSLGTTFTSSTTQTYIGTDGQTYTSTSPPLTYTRPPYFYGVDPTGSKVRTYTTAGFEEISHLRSLEARPAMPLVTPVPQLVKRAAGKILGPQDRWDTPASLPGYWTYNSVTVNAGFDDFFLEKGIASVFGESRGYGSGARARLAGLTALLALGLLAAVGRVASTVALLVLSHRKKKVERAHDQATSVYNRLFWTSSAFTALLTLTYLSFWPIYGAWTHRNGRVEEGEKAYASGAPFRLDTILSTSPWNATTTALIVLWSLSVLTSTLVVLLVHPRAQRPGKSRQSDLTGG